MDGALQNLKWLASDICSMLFSFFFSFAALTLSFKLLH